MIKPPVDENNVNKIYDFVKAWKKPVSQESTSSN